MKCNDCHWKYTYADECSQGHELGNNSCKDFCHKCDGCELYLPNHIYNGLYYCTDCLFELLKKRGLEVQTVTEFYIGGVRIGSDNDMGEVMDALNENYGIKDIDE